MSDPERPLPENLHALVAEAIRYVQAEIRWKPGKAQAHLGMMETVFPPDKPDTYFAEPQYRLLGRIKEIIT